MERGLLDERPVVGRITEKHLAAAEETFPGIARVYRSLRVKPATFLDLVWMYEELVLDELASAERGA
jgi:hypothetical protein